MNERNDIVEQYVTECVQRFLIMKASKQNLQNSFPSFKVFYLFMYLFIGIIYKDYDVSKRATSRLKE